ncbi:D-mannose-1-phosphate guanyltransferase [Chitinophaga silvatica]|uniref:D-mannose-1-phosphate guanyltransferase n=1 Tax=Chitinophaga silvatica TaxID=2282649 RepID=A0A3E1YGK5_9BACT|nr:nucleotidyltransferase family protein [Chitinophaga silvatica]RFS26502.1 D-mannose-1-phosphate guanyltransferase [Chitinophaga silvatica]
MSRECIILAGGLGTRLRTVVADKPKCMAPIGDQPFLYYLLQYLHQQNVSHAILSLGYLSEQVIDWCQNNPLPLRVSFSVEETPLGTGGGIMHALSQVEGDLVFIVNGDTYFDVAFNELEKFHIGHHAAISLALKPMQQFERYGSIGLNAEQQIIAFKEKQYCEEGLINGGIYLTSTSYLKNQGLPTSFSFEKEVLEPGVAKGNLYGYISDTYFIDIGIPSDYEAAKNVLVSS